MTVALLAILMLLASTAHADTMHVAASATWQLNPPPGVPNNQSQWFTASFDWDTASNLASSIAGTSSLGLFTSFYIQERLANFWTADGALFQVYVALYPYFHDHSLFSDPGEYSFGSGPQGFFLYQPNVPGWWQTGINNLSVTAVQTPEPGTLAMLLLGSLMLYVLFCYNQKVGNVVQLVRGKW